MKKRILIFSMVLALVAVMALPMATFAATSGTTIITGTLAAAAPTVTSVTPNTGIQGDTHTSIIIVGTNLTDATEVSLGAGITVNSYLEDSATQITADISITAGATAGARDVSVTTSGGTGTKTGGFTVVAATFSISAPANFNLGAMTRGAYTTAQGTSGSVTTNAQHWQVVATGNASHGGYMYNGTASPTGPFQFCKDGSTWDTADANLTYTQAGGTTLDFWGRQWIDADDPAGTYTITITFTGSIQ